MLKKFCSETSSWYRIFSGGQSEIEATENLNLINKYNDTNFIMSYSYGRALQQSALKHWAKDTKNIKGTQAVFNHRAKMCSLAAQGKWSSDLENIIKKNLFILFLRIKIIDISIKI